MKWVEMESLRVIIKSIAGEWRGLAIIDLSEATLDSVPYPLSYRDYLENIIEDLAEGVGAETIIDMMLQKLKHPRNDIPF